MMGTPWGASCRATPRRGAITPEGDGKVNDLCEGLGFVMLQSRSWLKAVGLGSLRGQPDGCPRGATRNDRHNGLDRLGQTWGLGPSENTNLSEGCLHAKH